MSKLNEKKTCMFPILAARLEQNRTDTCLNTSLLSEIKVHYLSVEKSCQDISRICQINSFLWSKHTSHLMSTHQILHKRNLLK
jgi:hypothetical protein